MIFFNTFVFLMNFLILPSNRDSSSFRVQQSEQFKTGDKLTSERDTIFINFSYFDWEDFFIDNRYTPFAIGYKDCGCTPENIVVLKKTKQPFTGVVILTEDRDEIKDYLLEKHEYLKGLRHGEWVEFGFDDSKSFYKRGIAHFKNGDLHGEAKQYLKDNDGTLLLSNFSNYEIGYKKGEFKNYFDGKLTLEGKILKSKDKSNCEDWQSAGFHPLEDKFGNLLLTHYIIYDGFVRKYGFNEMVVIYEELWEAEKLMYVKEWVEAENCDSTRLLYRTMEVGNSISDKRVTFLDFQPEEYNCISYLTKKESYLNGNADGSYIVYFDPIVQTLREKGIYKNGKKVGVWEDYIEGVLKSKTEYLDGEKDGSEELYNEDGKLFRKIRYKKGKVVEINH